MLQEAITNLIRHAEASLVDVQLEETCDTVILTIADNGKATEDTMPKAGFGLSNMAARCESMGGALTVNTLHPNGLRIKAVIPLARDGR